MEPSRGRFTTRESGWDAVSLRRGLDQSKVWREEERGKMIKQAARKIELDERSEERAASRGEGGRRREAVSRPLQFGEMEVAERRGS